jgi:CheY-like chemotaxis protein
MNMGAENSEYFELSALLQQSDLDIRHFAAANPLVSTAEFFSMLSGLSELAPSVSNALTKFANSDADRDACKSIENIIALLEKFGCEKLILDFHSILNAYGKKGNWREAAIYAKRIKQESDELCSRIMATKRTKIPDILSCLQNAIEMPLKELIERLDEEEAHRKLLILAVDDSPVILKAVSSLLSDTYKVFVLPKSTKVKDVMQKLTPELFLLDCQMPELTGFELVPVIRSFEEHKETPIIFLTSIGTIENVSTALALGACDFVVKPFKPDILREKIAKHIVRKKAF